MESGPSGNTDFIHSLHRYALWIYSLTRQSKHWRCDWHPDSTRILLSVTPSNRCSVKATILQNHHFCSGWQVKPQPAAAGWSQLGKQALKTHIKVSGYINQRERQAESSAAVDLAGDGAEGFVIKGRKKQQKRNHASTCENYSPQTKVRPEPAEFWLNLNMKKSTYTRGKMCCFRNKDTEPTDERSSKVRQESPRLARRVSVPSRQALPVNLEEQMPHLEGKLPCWSVQQHPACNLSM